MNDIANGNSEAAIKNRKILNFIFVGAWILVVVLGGVLIQFIVRDRNSLDSRIHTLEAVSSARSEVLVGVQQGVTRNSERINDMKQNIADDIKEIKEQLKEMNSEIKLLRKN